MAAIDHSPHGRRRAPEVPKVQMRGEQQAVLRFQARAIDLTTQHGNFMAQDEKFDIIGDFTATAWSEEFDLLGPFGAKRQHYQPEQVPDCEIDQSP